MQDHDVQSCLAALEAAEHALLEAGDIATLVHVSLAIDRFRATHRLAPRSIEAFIPSRDADNA